MSNDKKVTPYAGDLEALYPGEPVPLTRDDGPDAPYAVVYPMPFVRIEEHSRALYDLVVAFYRGDDGKGLPRDASGGIDRDSLRQRVQDKLATALPHVSRFVWDQVYAHTKPDGLRNVVPPDVASLLLVAFVKANFGDETRRKNWVAAAEGLMEMITGRSTSLSGDTFRSWLPRAWTILESVGRDSQTGGETDSRIVDGRSHTSGIASETPSSSSPTLEES